MNQVSERGQCAGDVKEGSEPFANFSVTQKKDVIASNNEVVEETTSIITYQTRRKRLKMTQLEITKEDASSSSHGAAHTVGTTSLDQPIEIESVTYCSESMSEKTVTAETTIPGEVVSTNNPLETELGFHGTSSNNDDNFLVAHSNENCDADMLPVTLPQMENDEATINRNSFDADMLANNFLEEVHDDATKTIISAEVRSAELEEEDFSNFPRVTSGDALGQGSLQQHEEQSVAFDADISSKQFDGSKGVTAECVNVAVDTSGDALGQNSLQQREEQSVAFDADISSKLFDGLKGVTAECVNVAVDTSGDALGQDSLQQRGEQSVAFDADISSKQFDGLKGITAECVNVAVDRAFSGSTGKKLLVLDVNGLLVDISSYVPYDYDPDDIIMRKAVFKRPYCDDFLKFCFERFNVGVWTSRTKRNVEPIIDFLLGNDKCKLLFCWDQAHCTQTGFTTVEKRYKPLLLKKLKKLWDKCEPDLPWERGVYNESNTILLDDTPSKALFNPIYNAVFPYTYWFRKKGDNSLGPGGDLRVYLEGLAMAENVQEYVKQNPFGQRPITEKNLSWGFYLRVIEASTTPPRQTEQNDS